MVPLVYSLIVFRRRKGDTTDAEHDEGNTTLEITWTIIPLMVVIVYAYLGAYTLGETRVVDPNALVINVTAHQWDWSFSYPEGQDVVPGHITEYRITPDLLGNYTVRCAELCGTSHAYMERPVIVTSQSDYDSWVTQQAAKEAALVAQGGPDAGKALVAQNGCGGCHSIDGSKLVGPTWRGLFESKVKLSDGSVVTADEAYLIESIAKPSAKVVDGFPDHVMPTFNLTDAQIKNIASYIETLK